MSDRQSEWDLSVEELQQLQRDGVDLVLLDVREPHEVERATLGGLRALALLLLGRVEEARDEVTQALELDEDNEVALAAQEELSE